MARTATFGRAKEPFGVAVVDPPIGVPPSICHRILLLSDHHLRHFLQALEKSGRSVFAQVYRSPHSSSFIYISFPRRWQGRLNRIRARLHLGFPSPLLLLRPASLQIPQQLYMSMVTPSPSPSRVIAARRRIRSYHPTGSIFFSTATT